jgi:hypothetical protein
MQLDRGKVVVKDQSSSGGMMMNNDEEPNNPCWNEEQEPNKCGGGWKAISFHGVPAVLISDKKNKL